MRKQEPEPDDIILELLAADNQRAINKLHATYYKGLFFSVRKYVQHDHEAATVINDLLFSIWEKRHTLSLRKPLVYYLYRSARNRILNFLRDKGRVKEIPTSPDGLMLVNKPSSSDSADQKLLQEDLHLLWAIAELHMTHRVRETFLLSQVENKTKEEIADAMGITVNAVEKNIARAFKVIEEISRKYFFILLMTSVFIL